MSILKQKIILQIELIIVVSFNSPHKLFICQALKFVDAQKYEIIHVREFSLFYSQYMI
jgi:hypothetical protein